MYLIFFLYLLLYLCNKISFYKIIEENLLYISSLILIIILVLIINLQNSACFLYPLKFTCISYLPWAFSEQELNIMSVHYENWAKAGAGPGYKISINPEIYIQNFNWFQNWFVRNKIEFLEHLSTLIVAPLFLFFINFFNKNEKIKIFNIKSKIFYICIILFILISFIIWISKSPVARFAIPFFIVALFHLIYFYINKKIYLRFNYKTVLITIFICLTINLSKNTLRVFKKDNIDNFWPIINENKFITINKITSNLSQYRPDSKLNSGHQGILCWNIDFICSYKNDKLKHKFYNNYLIIEK